VIVIVLKVHGSDDENQMLAAVYGLKGATMRARTLTALPVDCRKMLSILVPKSLQFPIRVQKRSASRPYRLTRGARNNHFLSHVSNDIYVVPEIPRFRRSG
jgi:hypothetical protein